MVWNVKRKKAEQKLNDLFRVVFGFFDASFFPKRVLPELGQVAQLSAALEHLNLIRG
jgi:hypothetical protein